MLGKRSFGSQGGSQPAGKRSAKSAYQGRNAYRYKGARVTKQFGPGYNPKQGITRMPPPGAERKFYDVAGAGATWTAESGNTPTYHVLSTLNNVAQGDTPYNRNGSKIMLTKLTMRMVLILQRQLNATAWADSVTSVIFRVIIGIDTQCNGAAPPIGALLDLDTANSPFNSFNNVRSAGRFKILCDEFTPLCRNTIAYNGIADVYGLGGVETHFNRTFNLNLPIQFTDGSGNLSAISTNNLFCFVLINNADGLHVDAPFRYRIRFTDY